MTRTPTLVALLVGALAANGCGGSSSTKTTQGTTTTATTTAPASAQTATSAAPAAGKPLTHRQWLAAGDAICARLNTELSATVVKRASEFAQALPQAVAYERAAFRQLTSLTPPRADAASWRALLLDAEQWIDDSAKLAVKAQAGGFSLQGTLARQASAHHERMARISRSSGFKQCSQV